METSIIDIIAHDSHRIHVLVDGQEQKLQRLDEFSEERNYGTCELVGQNPVHYRIVVPKDKFAVRDGVLSFERKE